MKYIEPMKAKVAEKHELSQPGWMYEVKYDGIRAMVAIENGKAKFSSRTNNSLTKQFPELATIVKQVKGHTVLLDCEIVALDENGNPSFRAIQPRIRLENESEIKRYTAGETNIRLIVFDILHIDDEDLCDLPLIRRRERLEKIVKAGGYIELSRYVMKDGTQLLEEERINKREGVIAKKCYSTYQPGKRSADWLKCKFKGRQEVVIGGFTAPKNSRSCFGSLVIGVYNDGEFITAGHVGTGFTVAQLKQIYDQLTPLARKGSPFANLKYSPEPITWVEPKLVCEIEFMRLTSDKHFYQPVFLGMRIDKNPEDVVFEIAS